MIVRGRYYLAEKETEEPFPRDTKPVSSNRDRIRTQAVRLYKTTLITTMPSWFSKRCAADRKPKPVNIDRVLK